MNGAVDVLAVSARAVAPATRCHWARRRSAAGRRRRRRASRWRGSRRRRRLFAAPSAHARSTVSAVRTVVAAEFASRRGRRRRPATPRGDGAVHAITTSNSSARSAASIAAGSRSVPITRIRRPSGWKSSKNTWAQVSAPGGLWAPSTIDERLRSDHLEAARHRRRSANALVDHVARPAGRRRTSRPR